MESGTIRFITVHRYESVHSIDKGIDGLDGKNDEQKSRFVDVATELFAITAMCSYAQYKIAQGEDRKSVLDLVDYAVSESKLVIDANFRGVSKNTDTKGYKLAQRVLAGEYDWLEKELVPTEY